MDIMFLSKCPRPGACTGLSPGRLRCVCNPHYNVPLGPVTASTLPPHGECSSRTRTLRNMKNPEPSSPQRRRHCCVGHADHTPSQDRLSHCIKGTTVRLPKDITIPETTDYLGGDLRHQRKIYTPLIVMQMKCWETTVTERDKSHVQGMRRDTVH